MYQQQQQLQSHQQQHLSSRSSSCLPPEKQFLVQSGGGDSGLILSTDAKPRLKWTPELHERFVDAVNQLGGPEKATPKTIMRLMGIPGLTLYHLKSHLQKYRHGKNLQAQKNVSGYYNRTVTENKVREENESPARHFTLEPQINRSMLISEGLQMQMEVQRRLQEQLEVQRHLQLRIEAQGKYLQSVLEKAQEALAKHNRTMELEEEEDASFKKQQQQGSREEYLFVLEEPSGGDDEMLTARSGGFRLGSARLRRTAADSRPPRDCDDSTIDLNNASTWN